MILISSLLIPLLVLFVVFYGIVKKINVYDVFIEGAKEGLEIGISMFPYMLGMILGINVLLKSNFLNLIFGILKPIFDLLNVPIDVLPLALLRPVSGSTLGPDSFAGRLASTLMGSTDTTIYILTLYFGTVGIKKIRYSLWAGLIADLAGIIASIIIVTLVF